MNTTGTSKVRNSSLTASRPEEPSASWISGENQAGLPVLGQCNGVGVGVGAGDADDVVAGILHQAFGIHRNEGLVLDDQHVGGDLRRHFASGGIGELAGLGDIDRQDERHPGARREIRKVCVQNAPAPPAPGHSEPVYSRSASIPSRSSCCARTR